MIINEQKLTYRQAKSWNISYLIDDFLIQIETLQNN